MSFRNSVAVIFAVIFMLYLYRSRKPDQEPNTAAPVAPISKPSQQKIVALSRQKKRTAQQPNPVAVMEQHNPGDVAFRMKGGYAVAFGDIVLGHPTNTLPPGATGFARFEAPRLWNSALISYAVRADVKNPDRITKALADLERETPLRFQSPQSIQDDVLIFEANDQVCGSFLGRLGGPQPILIDDSCSSNDIIHEVLHSLGFPHEHSRADRDQYVEVLYENIIDIYKPQFDIVPIATLDVLQQTGFDYNSIMLYPPHSFAKNPSLETLRSRSAQFQINPSTNGLSPTDKERIFRLFQNR